jgi:hypothetical protein
MVAMAVFKTKIFDTHNAGASIAEVLLAMAIVAMATPFVYKQIAQTNQTIRDIAIAKSIIATGDSVLNFVRTNQDKWPDTVQIQLDSTDLSLISPNAFTGFIDKYSVMAKYVCTVCGKPAVYETSGYIASYCDYCWRDLARHENGDWLHFKPQYKISGWKNGKAYEKTISFEDEWNRYLASLEE